MSALTGFISVPLHANDGSVSERFREPGTHTPPVQPGGGPSPPRAAVNPGELSAAASDLGARSRGELVKLKRREMEQKRRVIKMKGIMQKQQFHSSLPLANTNLQLDGNNEAAAEISTSVHINKFSHHDIV